MLAIANLSCREQTIQFIKPASYQNMKEERLGLSSYYVKFPSNFFLEEARGKEGQLGYGLWPIDSIAQLYGTDGFIEIEEGRPVTEEHSKISPFTDLVRSNLLGETVRWRLKIDNGFFEATTNRGKLTLSASSNSRAGLDSMIAIISTLSSR
jgi:hypothetical protein